MEVRSIEAIVTALNTAQVQYLIVGGLAVAAHGYQRLTADVDLVIGLQPENITRALYALEEVGYQPSIPISPEDFARAELRDLWRQEKGMLVLKLSSDAHRRTPIDVFVYEPFDFTAEYRAAKSVAIMGEVQAPVISYPALLAMKADAGRAKDLLDIQMLHKLDPYR